MVGLACLHLTAQANQYHGGPWARHVATHAAFSVGQEWAKLKPLKPAKLLNGLVGLTELESVTSTVST